MTDDQHRERLFLVLRQALKARGYTYSQLAQALDVSELTIKRLFRDKDCKMSRLIEICSVIDLDISDLMDMQKRISPAAHYLPLETEQAISQQPNLFAFLILLLSQISPQAIACEYQLTDSQLYHYLRQLEKLAVIEILPENKVRFQVPMPIRLRFHGVLGEQVKQVNQQFIGHCLDHCNDPQHSFLTASRLMRPESIIQIQEQLAQLQSDFDYLAAQDQMFYNHEDLQLYKIVYGLGPFPAMKFLPLS